MKRATLAIFLALAVGSAIAQRRSIPVVELIDVPVSIATTRTMTADQVKATIITAALASDWDIELQTDGTLRLLYLRDFESRIEMSAKFTGTSYSLRYLSSENLNYAADGEVRNNIYPPLPIFTKDWRATRAARQPEFKYAVDQPNAIIHPAYEAYVYEFSASIRRHLRYTQ